MSQTAFSPEVTLATLGNYIKKDGTTTTTARIPFAAGISLNNGSESSPALNFTADTDTGLYGFTSGLAFAVDGDTIITLRESGASTEQGMLIEKYGVRIMTSAQPFTFGADYGAPSLSGVVNTGFYVSGGLVGGGGLKVYIRGAVGDGFDNAGEKVYISGGLDNTLGSGWVQIGESGSPEYWSTSVGAEDNLYIGGDLEVTGTSYLKSSVYLKSLTGAGILKIDSNELVAVATAGTDYITSVGVTSPITSTGGGSPTIGFDVTANFSWSGTHAFTNAVTASTFRASASSAQYVFDSTSGTTTTLQDSAATTSKTLTLPNVTATLAHIGSASQIFAGLCTFSSTSGIILSSTSPSITFTDTTASEDDFVFSTISGGFRLNNSTDSVIAFEVSGAGVNTYNAASGQYHVFNVNNSEELRIAANRLTTNNGSSDMYLDWSTNGRLDIGGGGYTFINAGAIIASSAITPHATGYELSIQSNGASTYQEILNGYGTGAGMFFGIAGSGAEGDAAEIWNYQGGPLHIYTAPTAADGTITFKVSEDGYIGFQTGKRFYLEMDSSGNFGDTYHYYDSGSSRWKFYVNGALAMELA